MSEFYSNFLSLYNMLIETTKLLRQRFLCSFKEICNMEWTDKKGNDFFKNGAGKEIRNSCKKIQKICLDSGNSNEWDITLLCTILSSKIFLRKKLYSHILIQKISSVRNRICHSPSFEITDTSFDELSNELIPLMLELGASEDYVLELKNNKGFQTRIVEPDKNAQFLKESANEEFKNKSYEHAIEIYTSAIILPNLTNQELGILHRNRSLSYLKLYEKTNDAINLDRAIADAKKTCFYHPVWFKGYAQLGDIYHKMNELEKAVKNYEKALAFSTNNEGVKNSLASLKAKLGEQYRHEHLKKLPFSNEEHEEQLLKQLQNIFSSSKISNLNISDFKKTYIEADPTLKDVWAGHEYRDGSKNVKQNYETAAKYYSKAAQSNNAEGIYNLACLTMNGLGVRKDFEAALSLLNEAAKQKSTRKLLGTEIVNVGVRESEHSLGLAYQEGTYVPKNLSIASKWYQLAVEHGSPQSANNLGLMYFNGNGVDRNIKQAEALFILSHERGDVNASANLVDLYIHKLDPDRALAWHEKSLQSSYLLSKLNDKEIRKKIEDIKSFNKIQKDNEQANIFVKNFQIIADSSRFPSNITHQFNIKELVTYSENGSETASEMLNAIDLFCTALSMLDNSNFNKMDFLTKLSKAFLTCQIVCKIPLHRLEEMLKVANSVIDEKKNQKTEIDYNARICFVYLNYEDFNLNINFLKLSLKIYPNDIQMLHILGSMYSLLKKYENASEVFENVCSLHPSNYKYIYSKAVILRLLGNSDATFFYEKFISTAPADHRKVPESYYALGICSDYFEKNKLDSKKLENLLFYYNKGLESEKLQLSCFLPYKSNSKKFLENYISLVKHKSLTNISKNVQNRNKIPKILEQNNEDFRRKVKKNEESLNFVDYKKREVVLNHRKAFKMFKEVTNQTQSATTNCLNLSYKPIKSQKIPDSIIGLKAIYLKDIDFTKDYIITGHVLTVTSIDVPLVGILTSVHFVVEDENQFVMTVCIYNLGEDYPSIKKKFSVGCIFSIIDPYIRLAADGKPMIRVDDPNSVIISSKRKVNMCFYCGKEQSTYTCSKCKTAKYCSKQCQIDDWKILQHKDVCNYLFS